MTVGQRRALSRPTSGFPVLLSVRWAVTRIVLSRGVNEMICILKDPSGYSEEIRLRKLRQK